MQELDRARAHLLLTQDSFRHARCLRLPWADTAEQHFLAALSWVWDAQERQTEEAAQWLHDRMERALIETLAKNTKPTFKTRISTYAPA